MRIAATVAVALALLSAGPSAARPMSLDDLLRTETLQEVRLAPDGRHLIVATSAPYDQATTYDSEAAASLSRARLTLYDLAPRSIRVAPPSRTLAGVSPGPLSPGGGRMVVFRLRAGDREAGVLTLATGRVVWLGLPSQMSGLGRTVQWRSEHALVLLSPPPGLGAEPLQGGARTLKDLDRRRQETWAGRAGLTSVGSGRYARLDPSAAALWLVDPAGGRRRLLARGAFQDVELSASGRFAALTERAQDPPLAGRRSLSFADVTPERRLRFVDIDRERSWSPSPDLDLAATLLAWAPERQTLLIFARRRGQAWSEGAFVVVDAASGAQRRLDLFGAQPALSFLDSEQLPIAVGGWRGDAPLVLAHGPSSKRDDWYEVGPVALRNLTSAIAVPPHRFGRTAAHGLVFDAPDGSWTLTAQGELHRAPSPLEPSVPSGDPDEPLRVALASPTPPRASVVRPADPASDRACPRGRGVRSEAAHTASAKVFLDRGRGGVELLLAGRRDCRRLLQLNGWVREVEAGPVEALHRKAADGTALTDWLYLPPGSPVGSPLVVVPYPGSVFTAPPTAFAPGEPTLVTNPLILAAAGYAVLVPSLPASRSPGDPAAGLVEGVRGALAAIRDDRRIDARRVAVWGHSFGGYAALVLATRTDLFAAVVAGSAPTDLVSVRGVFPPLARAYPWNTRARDAPQGWSEAGQGGLGGPPWSAPERYVQASPIFAAGRVSAPVLLVYGEQDFVGVGQGEEMFSALRRQDKDARLLTFWGEGHVIASPGNVRALYAAVIAFLAESLRPGGRPLATAATTIDAPTPPRPPGPAAPNTRPAGPGFPRSAADPAPTGPEGPAP